MTAQRNVVWMKNLTLFEDTVEKSPLSAMARNQYGIALILANNYDKAEQQLKIGRSLNILNDAMLPETNLAAIAIQKGNPDDAVKIYNKMLLDSHGKSERAVRGLLSIYENKSLHDKNPSTNSIKQLIQSYEQLYKLNANPHYMYRVGHLSYLVGDKKKSLAAYRMAFDKYPDGNEYKAFAKKHIMRLEKE
jgi:tetratricopeptide (TPR) repeat protein